MFAAWRAYFGLSVYHDDEEEGRRWCVEHCRSPSPAIYTFVPHGLFPFGLALVSGVLFKGENIPVAIASNLFYVPVIGLLLRLLGCVPAGKELFKTGASFVLVPDGIAGAFTRTANTSASFCGNAKGSCAKRCATATTLCPCTALDTRNSTMCTGFANYRGGCGLR